MRKFHSHFQVLSLIIAFGFGALAHAQQIQTYISASGNDGGSCQRNAPCRTLARAVAVIAGGDGEVIVLDSGDYGAVKIESSITIHAPEGVHAGVSVTTSNGDGVTINAGANDIVVLRGLTLNGEMGKDGIKFNSG